MTIEITHHGAKWINLGNLEIKCPECNSRDLNRNLITENDKGITMRVGLYECIRCGCNFRMQREIF